MLNETVIHKYPFARPSRGRSHPHFIKSWQEQTALKIQRVLR